MTENTKIEWATHTFNPWVGCTKVSPGCDHCYAETWAKRTGSDVWGHGKARRRTSAQYWRKPLAWEERAKSEEGGDESEKRPRVFPSLCDPFDAEADPEVRRDFWELVKATPHLDWLLLTKRPGNVGKMVPRHWMEGGWPANVWLGTSVETRYVRWRLEKLYEVRERVVREGGRIPVLFASFEPLLSDLGLAEGWPALWEAGFRSYAHLVDWGIFGGESGGQARPCALQWIRAGRDALHAAGKAVFVKQLGAKPLFSIEDLNATACEGVRFRPEDNRHLGGRPILKVLKDRKGGDMAEWPEDLRVREMPR